MAFGAVLISGFAFTIVLGFIVYFILTLAVFIILSILRKKNDMKILRIFQFMSGYMLVISVLPIIFMGVAIASSKKETIDVDGKKVKIRSEIINNFYSSISSCSPSSVKSYLKNYPELIFSKSSDGLYPLGYAIKYEQLDCIHFFVEKEVDINKPSDNWGTLEYMFNYDYYDNEILEYVLSNETLDINKRHKAIPVAQLYIKSIIKDDVITDEEADFFDKMVSKGLDLTDKNGSNIDTYSYLDKLKDIDGLDKIEKILDREKH